MHPNQIVLTFLFGCCFVVLSFTPGLLRDLMRGFLEGIERFRQELEIRWRDPLSPQSNWMPHPVNVTETDDRDPAQIFFAAAGGALILLSLIAFFTR
jgi:hypothetical protein